MKAPRGLIIALAAAVAAAQGCSFSKPDKTPQQQFAEALMRGNSMQASQIWLQMSPEDRLKFSRGQGISPEASQNQVKRQIENHYQEEMEGAEAGSAPATGQELPTPLGASLQRLPGVSAPPAETAPPGSN